MDKQKISAEEKLEKELKTLVSRMKSENAALNKILIQLISTEDDLPETNTRHSKKKKIVKNYKSKNSEK
jgi:mRNA-degrading endonuclease YafQ of YafQ-DinJ toxin-antitoxin module